MNATTETINEPKVPPNRNLRFHGYIACVCATLVAVTFAGCQLTSIHLKFGGEAIGLLLVFAMISPLPIYWHDRGRLDLRESSLVLPWEALLVVVIPYVVLVAARLRMPIQDSLLGRMDQALGVSVPAIVRWAHHHWLGAICTRTYPLLIPLLAAAALAPALLGKVKYAREFLVANLAAFAIGMPLFALLPAIGPWQFYHTLSNTSQAHCEAALLALRLSSPITDSSQLAGLVCFPSFHVIWAILCCAGLWGFRYFRIPVMLLSVMIIVSTLTTGWHYFSDVLAGLIISALSLAFAKWCTRKLDVGLSSPQRSAAAGFPRK